MKAGLIIIIFFTFYTRLFSQDSGRYASTFTELKALTERYKAFWGVDLYCPVLLVDPNTRAIVANVPDSAGSLAPVGSLYKGQLPTTVNIANMAVEWSGRRWAMLMLPLPVDRNERMQLLVHEMFHQAQPRLGFSLSNPENVHLDEREARIYLRLELQALYAAVLGEEPGAIRQSISDALSFRNYRRRLYAASDTTENLLELNEGLAEYTGFRLSGRNKKQARAYFKKALESFYRQPGFVRSFAYQSIPLYGYLLSQFDSQWHKKISRNEDLTAFFARSFAVDYLSRPTITRATILKYGGEAIEREEKTREENLKAVIESYKKLFVDDRHLEIRFEQMNVSFNPTRLLAIGTYGTYYPNLRVVDKWGILSCEKGALMSPQWDKLSLTLPLQTTPSLIAGDGWKLELSPGYKVMEMPGGNYMLVKK